MARWMAWLCVAASWASAASPVETHGWLSVQGNQVVDQLGRPAKLRGMSFFWSQWIGKYWNAEVVDWLVKDWEVSLVRAAMAVDNGGYLTTPSEQEAKVRAVVDAAIQRGVYVIIDWHEENAVEHQAQSIAFFQKMARDYGKHPNVIYEIYNEPVKQPWWQIKNYATEVVKAIREIDGRNLIIVGNPSWSAEVDKPAADPVPGTNIAYTLHFYAASHGQWLRDRADAAMRSGIALFATEWGTCEYTGNGRLDLDATRTWLDWMDDRGISWANWSVSDKAETCAALVGAGTSGGWSGSQLSPSGAFVREQLRSRNDYPPGPQVLDTFAVPGRVDAAKPVSTVGAILEEGPAGAGKHLAYIDDGSSATWTIRSAGSLRASTSVSAASESAGGSIRWLLDGREVGRSVVTGTTGWRDWTLQPGPSFDLGPGVHTLKLEFSGTGKGLFNLDEILFSSTSPVRSPSPDGIRSWRIEGRSILVSGSGSRTVRLSDAKGRVLSVRALAGGSARLPLGDARGLRFLETSDGFRQAIVVP